MNVPGHNIRILREAMGLSMRSLATAAEIDVAALSRLEAGTSSGRRSSIEKIARALAVSFDTLYAPVEMVEAAALRMRNVPVLAHHQIRAWVSGTIKFTDEQRFVHADLKRASSSAFCLDVVNEANAPLFARGDHMLFDARKSPVQGDFVVCFDNADALHVGRFRPLPMNDRRTQYQVVPLDPMRFPIVDSDRNGLTLFGKLIESRRYF